ncbi:type I-G CRISPR-associated protein Csb2 [Flaviflexus massiliensis]|uniref:type I-G CRISPR-associated protein Csb2 n=1 Tax=Flaviflexus massiliensis TaxID=1522309 RepID=UPI00097DE4B1|nr:type I-U CRISPR-associated protein Csb2 [Flaviflexus massiliensis]
MVNSLTARWPHGIYLGHHPDGSPELFPSFARVFSALVSAGNTGISSLSASSIRVDSEEFASPEQVLLWLESNPPKGLCLPPVVSGRRFEALAYRKEGVFKKEGKALNYKVTGRAVGEGTAIGGTLSWVWDQDFPDPIRRTLELMCADVGCLGEASSLVILELADNTEITHEYSAGRQFFKAGGIETQVVKPGRLKALQEQYSIAHPEKLPSEAQDRHNTSAMPVSEIPSSVGLGTRRLIRVNNQNEQAVPWDKVIAIPIEEGPEVRPEGRVAFAVATHRALIARIGNGAPASITGKYEEGVTPTANRIGIQYLPVNTLSHESLEAQAHLLLLIPSGLPESELQVLSEALSSFQLLRSRFGRFNLSPDIQFLSGAEFWQPPAPGSRRIWTISPAAIPERWATGGSQEDVYFETITWSLGNTLRDLTQLDVASRPEDRAAALAAKGFTVHEARPLTTKHPTRYVHRTNKTMPALPYTARIELGTLVPHTALLAIGQSRHLGGGLLVPQDLNYESEVCNDHGA